MTIGQKDIHNVYSYRVDRCATKNERNRKEREKKYEKDGLKEWKEEGVKQEWQHPLASYKLLKYKN